MRRFFYRIFDDIDGQPATLFHGVRGSRKLLLDQWHEAAVKPVTDGSGVTVYQSGFHVLPRIEDVAIFLRKFRHLENRVIAKVEIDVDAGIWPKTHSKSPIILAKKMRIRKSDWEKRIKAILIN
jgi:hypothetical protein